MEFSIISNDTALELTLDDTKYERENRSLVEQAEELKQQLHDINRQLETKKLINSELEIEIQKLKMIGKNMKLEYEIEKQDIIRDYKLRANVDEETEEKENQYSELMEKYQKLLLQQVPSKVSDTSVLEDNTTLEIQQIKEELFKKKETMCILNCAINDGTERINTLEGELEIMRESIKCKNNKLEEVLNALEEVKEGNALLSSELAILMTGPTEGLPKQKSLFAEMEDKRANVEIKLVTMHKKYIEMKKMLSIKANELESAKKENRKLQSQFQEVEKELKELETNLIESYRQMITEISHQVRELQLRRPNSPQRIIISDRDLSNLDRIHSLINETRAEGRELWRTLQSISSEKQFLEEKMNVLVAEVKNLKLKLSTDNALKEIQNKLSSQEISGSIGSTSSGLQETEKKGTAKTLRFADDVKEID